MNNVELALEKAKVKCFLSKQSGFIGSLLCNVDIVLTDKIDTARTNGIYLQINPDFFSKLDPDNQVGLLLHEMNHIGRLHPLRIGTRDPVIFNIACDIVINNQLDYEGYSLIGWCMDHKYDNLSEEEVYEKLNNAPKSTIQELLSSCKGNTPSNDVDASIGDSSSEIEKNKSKMLNNSLRASQEQAKKDKGWGNGDGYELNKLLDKYLCPKIPWNTILRKFLTELKDPSEPTWRRPNRRYSDMYLPSLEPEENRLEHLIFFLDTSGSITEKQLHTFNTELRYIWDTLNPLKLSIVQFHTKISKEEVLNDGDYYKGVTIAETGGTSYECVHDYIEKHNPTAAVIFTDLYCEPMEPVKNNIPVYWIATNTDKTEKDIKYGEYIKLEEMG